jgi:PPOX class probable F420-dependent enzyme
MRMQERQPPPMTEAERRFVEAQRVARLATADARGAPHVVPVCFALAGSTAYVTIDAKPKRVPAARLKRLRNLAENPEFAIVFDRYAEDWARLGWVMLRGRAELLEPGGEEHGAAQALLRARYAQYAAMPIAEQPVIALRIARCTSWGDLSPLGEGPAAAI